MVCTVGSSLSDFPTLRESVYLLYEPKPQTARLLLKPYFIHRQFPCCIAATSSAVVNFLQRKITHLKADGKPAQAGGARQVHRKVLQPARMQAQNVLSKTQRLTLANAR